MDMKLWTFGDSLTAAFSKDYPWSNSYINWKGYQPKVYGDFISETLNLDLINLGRGGSDNYTIFESFCNVSDKFNEGDLVIFGWSSPIRFRLVNGNDIWNTLLPSYNGNYMDVNNISINTIEEILVHRENIKFCDEVNCWIKLINNFLNKINVTALHWTTFDKRLNAYYIQDAETIKSETNGFIIDEHFSENGHIKLAKKLIELSNTKKVKTLI